MDRPESSAEPTAVAEGGTVRVRIRSNRRIEVAWLALTDPVRLAMWFGQLDQPWLVERSGRIEFGDGDFFSITCRDIVDGRSVEFDWSFLGVGPVDRIRWTVSALPNGSEILVEDHNPQRTQGEIDQMIAGWTDFFQRLHKYLATGQATRYDWREDIDGAAELPSTDFEPLSEDALYRWMPIATDGFAPRWFFIVDDQGPRRFRLDDFDQHDGELTFTVEIPEAVRPTRCRVGVEQVGTSRRLQFSHTGWRALGLPDSRSRTLRSRFAATWIASLRQARDLAAASGPSGDQDRN